MSDILAIFGILLFLGLSYPGLLLTWRLLFPNLVSRAQTRLERSPWKCFWMGTLIALFVLLPAFFLISRPAGVAKLLGWLAAALLMAFSSLGAAGQAARLGSRLAGKSSQEEPSARFFLGGALALEMASAFPLIGWLLVFPLSTLTSLGAAVFALLHWMPVRMEITKTIPIGEASPEVQAA